MSTETKDPGVKVEGSTVTITNLEKFNEHLERMRAQGVKTIQENYDFKYTFSEEEKAQKAQQLARACKERNGIEDEKKSVMANFKAKIDSATAEMNLLSNQIANGYEYLTKTCVVIKDFDKGVREYFYEGVKVGEAKLKPFDYQEVIEFAEIEEPEHEGEEHI
jgi:hypothetical protein